MRVRTESGDKIEIRDANRLGEGGEAWVFRCQIANSEFAAKIYKGPDAPDYEGDSEQDRANREGAKRRLETFANKIVSFPANVPDNVMRPLGLLYHRSKPVGFYTRLVPEPRETLRRYCDIDFRLAGIDADGVVAMLINLHQTVARCHAAGLVLGDFNDLNVLGLTPYIIDAESGSYGGHQCTTFTQRFVDPLLCDPQAKTLRLIRPHTPESDHYAFTIMVFQSLLFISPYDGKYKPKDKSAACPHDARPLFRKTVFNDDTIYPKWAVKAGYTPDILPDDLVHYFQEVLHDDRRGEFPIHHLQSMRWTSCTKCGAIHARHTCPRCATPGVVRSVVEVKGTVTSELIFKIDGMILNAAFQHGKLRYIYYDGKDIFRENGDLIAHGPLVPRMRYRVCGDKTGIAKGNSLVIKAGSVRRVNVDTYNSLPMFDADAAQFCWLDGGRLLTDDQHGIGQLTLGQVLSGQTLFWVGDTFGFGFYRALNLNEFFVFDPRMAASLKDGLAVPPLKGQLIDAKCEFSGSHCWFMVAFQFGGKIIHRCVVLNQLGEVLGVHEEDAATPSWLDSLRGKCAVGSFLFSVTDAGVTRVECQHGQIVQTKLFPDTEPFVDENCHLFAGNGCLHVVTKNEIRQLKIA